jgi:hypothetical protein
MPASVRRTKASIVLKDGKHYLVRGRQRQELQPLVASGEDLQAVVGKEVQLATEPHRTIVGFRTPEVRIVCYLPPRPRWWMCYLPRPELLHGIEDKVRQNLLDRLLQEGVIDQEVAEKLR